jgi:flavin reductase (DIM6/NTAB) family NADH-FMN oxidoreductase RutF
MDTLKQRMITIDPKITYSKLQGYLQSSVGPRPIAFVSTVDRDGNPNLSPLVSLMYLVHLFLFFTIKTSVIIA